MSGNAGYQKQSKTKRKRAKDHEDGRKKRFKNSDLPLSERLPKHGFPLDHPYNKDGYRYCLAEPDPHIPDNDNDEDYAKPVAIPAKVYRKLEHPIPLLSSHDRAPQLLLDDDRLSIKGDKGYSMARSTHGARKGRWYFEVKIISLPDDTAIRVGWSQIYANVQTPLGFDEFGYSIRSKKGTVFHRAKGKSYTNKVGFKEGDVIGCEIFLPDGCLAANKLPDTLKEATLIKFKNFYYFESRDHLREAKESLKSAPGSEIRFYRNGKSLGQAFADINDGIYYPAVSLYRGAKVKVNFGEKGWSKTPETSSKFRPMFEMGYQGQIEQAMSDLLFAVDLKINGII